jgi:TldD protein
MWPGDRGMYFGGGWEVLELAELRENAARIGEEAHQLLSAPQCPSGTLDVILGGSQVSLQIHESCGHAAELDRIMGWEANFSGTSFLDPAERGRLHYGSPIVTIEIDNTMRRGFATVGYDDEAPTSFATASWSASRARATPPSRSAARRPRACAPRAGSTFR